MAWQFLLHGRDVDHSALCCSSTRPRVVDLILFLLLFLILVPLDPAREQSIQNLVDLHLLPLRRHEVALGRRVRVDGEGVVVVVLDLEGGVGECLGGHFAAPDPVDEIELFVIEPDVALVELIPDGAPPVLILGLLDELGDLVVLLLLGDLLQVLVVAEMLELIIPPIGNTANLDPRQLVLLIV